MIRTFRAQQLSASEMASRKGGLSVSVCLPARDEEATVGPIVAAIRRHLVDEAPLVDEIVVLDDHSIDATGRVAAEAGARVVRAAEVAPDVPRGPGKGTAMWKSLQVTTSDVVVWCDADIEEFDAGFITGLVGPLVEHPDLVFVKGFYERPIDDQPAGGGRVTELVARPLISLLFGELSSIVQPLSGEYAGRRFALEQMPFSPGYGVDLGLLVDLVERFGTDAIAQCDLGVRRHRNRTLEELGPQAAAVLLAALSRTNPKVVGDDPTLVRPGLPAEAIDDQDLPPVAHIS